MPDRPKTLTKKEVNAIARVLADPRRFEILRHIAAQPSAACTDLREAFPISAANALAPFEGTGIGGTGGGGTLREIPECGRPARGVEGVSRKTDEALIPPSTPTQG